MIWPQPTSTYSPRTKYHFAFTGHLLVSSMTWVLPQDSSTLCPLSGMFFLYTSWGWFFLPIQISGHLSLPQRGLSWPHNVLYASLSPSLFSLMVTCKCIFTHVFICLVVGSFKMGTHDSSPPGFIPLNYPLPLRMGWTSDLLLMNTNLWGDTFHVKLLPSCPLAGLPWGKPAAMWSSFWRCPLANIWANS